MKLQEIKWIAVIDGREYGERININIDNPTGKDIKEASELTGEVIKLSIQKIINGKNDIDLMAEKAEEDYKNAKV